MRTALATAYSASHLSDAALLTETAPFAAGERSSLVQLLVRIAEIDDRQLYRSAAHSSMVGYCVEELRLTEDEALKRIYVARTARAFPLLFKALDEGRICLSRIRMLAAHLTPENVEELLSAASSYRSFSELRRFLDRFVKADLLAQPAHLVHSQVHGPVTLPDDAAPQPAVSPPTVPAAPALMADLQVHGPVTTPLDESEWLEVRVKVRRSKLQKAKDLLSHAVPSGNALAIFDRALDALIEKTEKRKYAACSKPRAPRPRSERERSIPAHVRLAVWQRDGGQCTFKSESGRRCSSRRLIEYDHVVPVAQGGESTVENLRLRCRAHNQYEAERAFGADFMKTMREQARETRARAAQNRAEEPSSTAVADAPQAGARFREDVIAGLRALGARAGEVREILENSGALGHTTLEESMRAAMRFLGPRRRRSA